jgi:signal transduction histidine kinase
MAAPALQEPRTGDARRRAGLAGLWFAGLTAGGWLLVLGLTEERAIGHRVTAVLLVAVGVSFVASGLIAWRRRPDNRLGPVMVVLGLWWLIFNLMKFSGNSVVFTAGVLGNDAFLALLVPFLVAFPGGQLVSRTSVLLAAPFAIAAVPLEVAWLLFSDPRGGAPGNALLVWPNEDVADAIDTVQRVLLVSGAFLLTAVLARRWLRASPPLRRGLTPLVAGAATMLVATGALVVSKLTGGDPPQLIQNVLLISLVGIAVGVLVDILRARLARLAVGDLIVELSRDREPEQLRAALARALGDPSLRLAYWLPEFDTFADLEGRPLELPADERRVTRMVDRAGTPVAALLHDPSLRDEPALLDSVGAAAGIALENARLHAEVRAAGTRVLEATQSERRRLERDLHDGAQQRLVALSLELGMLQARLGEDPDARSAVEQARRELTHSLEELRELARGIHPAILSGHGLEAALEGLAARAPVPVRVTVEVKGELPEAVEVATYFLVSESLTNVAKYAHATSATVDVVRANGDLLVDIADDGVGGASAERGSGLRGLADRVEALGGRLVVTSPAGNGTRVRAAIPCG